MQLLIASFKLNSNNKEFEFKEFIYSKYGIFKETEQVVYLRWPFLLLKAITVAE